MQWVCLQFSFFLESATHFSGIGEKVSPTSESASSRACSLKHERDCHDIESIFTSEDYNNLSREHILELVIPVIEKYNAVSIFL